jgi:hypothetical protein
LYTLAGACNTKVDHEATKVSHVGAERLFDTIWLPAQLRNPLEKLPALLRHVSMGGYDTKERKRGGKTLEFLRREKLDGREIYTGRAKSTGRGEMKKERKEEEDGAACQKREGRKQL